MKKASAIKETRILIVENRASVAEDLQQTLENLGYTVLAVASSGEAAIQKAAGPRPDLVLTDVVLEAELDGIAAAAQIRNHFDVPVIFVTSQADDEVLRQASVVGPCGYILKPFDARELHINIQMALCRHEMERKLRESEENFRTLAKNANDGILIGMGKEGTHVYANARAAEITGYSVAELRQTNIEDLAHPDLVNSLQERYTKRLEGGSAPRQYETRIIRQDGQSVHIELTAAKTTWQGQPADIVILRHHRAQTSRRKDPAARRSVGGPAQGRARDHRPIGPGRPAPVHRLTSRETAPGGHGMFLSLSPRARPA